MSSRTGKKQLNRVLIVGIPIILILIIIRFAVFYIKTEKFSGLSMLLPLFAMGILIFAMLMSGFIAAWVYEDCRQRSDDGILWAVVVFFTTPFIGLLVYFLRRPEIKQKCPSCGQRVSQRAKYCEECGIFLEREEGVLQMERRTHHLRYIVTGVIGMVLMFICLTGFIVSAANGGNINTSVSSDQKIWNTGIITMSRESNWGNTWNLKFRSASRGFIKETKMKIEDPEKEKLYVDVQCGNVPKGAALTLWLVQGDKSESIDVTNLSETLEYSLNEFENGRIRIRLVIDDVEDVSAEVVLK